MSENNSITDDTMAIVQQYLVVEDHSDTETNVTEIPVPYHLPGAAVTHDIYNYANNLVKASIPRSRSFTDLTNKKLHEGDSSDEDSTAEFSHLDKPGGLRRYHVAQQQRFAHESPQLQPETAFQELFRPDSICSEASRQDYTTGLYKVDTAQPVTRHFFEYLAMTSVINQFAGEDLSDSEEDDGVRDDEEQVSESTALLPNRHHANKKRKSSEHKANVTKTVFLLFKAFIGSGILFLPKAFSNGGLLFSIVTMWVMGSVSLYCFLLLLDCKKHLTGSYGDMGGKLYGSWMRSIVLFSIAISQVYIYALLLL